MHCCWKFVHIRKNIKLLFMSDDEYEFNMSTLVESRNPESANNRLVNEYQSSQWSVIWKRYFCKYTVIVYIWLYIWGNKYILFYLFHTTILLDLIYF